jgi:uncharacterized membrane protein YqaE (UPF0057 family)
MTAGQIVAALLLPPLAIFLAEGVTRNFWIGFGLTCLGYLPGVFFAFFALSARRNATTTNTAGTTAAAPTAR